MSEQQAAIDAATQMTAAVNGLSARVDGIEERWARRDEFLTAYGRGNRLRAWIAGVAAAAALGLAIAVAILYVQVSTNAATIAGLHAVNVSNCRAANVTRAEQVQLWQHVITVSQAQGRPGESAAQREQGERVAAQFLAYVRHVFAARNCTAAYSLRGK